MDLKQMDSFKQADIRPEHLQKKANELFISDIKRLQQYKDAFVNVACPACESVDSNEIFKKYDMSFVRCLKCETIYINPRPTPEILEVYYSQSELYRYFSKYIFPFSEDVRREKIFRPRVERIIEICRKYHVENNLLLEVGSGFGTFCELIIQAGLFHKVVAVERTPDLAEACRRKGIDVIEKPIEQVDPGEKRANVVASFEVIEHLFCPKDFIVKCGAFLPPGGLIVLTCPNSKGFDMQVLKELSHTFDAEHLNYFTAESLSILLERSGFAVLEVSTPGRLDAELVRQKALDGEFDLSRHPFLKQVLIDKWDAAGGAFQDFLRRFCLSSHMWIVGLKR